MSRIFDLTRQRLSRPHVDDQTWLDLEFPKILRRLNTTLTAVGSQCLYERLRTYDFDSNALARRYRAYQDLRADESLRERLQYALLQLDVDAADYLADIILGRPPEKPPYYRALGLWSVCSVIGLTLVPFLVPSLWLTLGILVTNTVLLFKISPELNRDIDALLTCQRMLIVADNLAKAAATNTAASIPQLRTLIEQKPLRQRLRRHILGLSVLSLETSMAGIVFLLLNVFFLTKVIVYGRTVSRFKESRDEWASILYSVGDVDASIAIAGHLNDLPDHCQPLVTDERAISFDGVYHPLLASPIKNDLALRESSALVTGSNMAGKTTFIKTVAINIIFGHTLGICCAAAATIPRTTVMSAIRRDQSVESGKSRYFVEVESFMAFIDAALRGTCRVFVVDELLSGTNALERLAIAKAILEQLSTHAQVLATTHDVELQSLLPARFSLYHFQEDPGVEGFFDYRLRHGFSSRQNAIRILERIGMAPEVVQEALRVADLLRQKSQL